MMSNEYRFKDNSENMDGLRKLVLFGGDKEKNNQALSTDIIRLDSYRRSISPGIEASRPKYQVTTPSGEIYFKFRLTQNEIAAEIFSYHIGKLLSIPVAETHLAIYKDEIGIASYDIGYYTEPNDSESYSIKQFLNLDGFVDMCLFDYVIMNEDRHAGNWGIIDNKVAPLFDHNNCFGGSEPYVDFDYFMTRVTSSFYVNTEYEQSHDKILEFFVCNRLDDVKDFMQRLSRVNTIVDTALIEYDKNISDKFNYLLRKRIGYMFMKVGEYCGR